MVLDTSAFIAGFDPFTIREEQVVPPMVEEEVKRNALTILRFNMAVESGRLKIFSPSKEATDKAEAFAASVGDSFFLSQADIQVLALALEIKERGDCPQIVTDDYSIQNVATKLGMGFVSLATFGIRRLLNWIRYCPACHRTYPANYKGKECTVCGTKLKRKPQRQREADSQKDKQKNQK
ncbi:MAG: ribonuclease VapC [Candidatus Bathyarchaeota archaeon]|nr:ribonuclease VapC [Candidatus Bathyarchaeota archaeon]